MFRSALMIIAVTACCSMGALAQEPRTFSSATLKQLTASVESVNHDNRTLILKDENGARTFIVAGPQVRNFEQINEGDRVVASYHTAVAVQVKPQGGGDRSVATTKQRAPQGSPPAARMGSTVVDTVTIESVDTSFDTVTFTRNDGITRTVAVDDPKAKAFIRELKSGDEVQVTYTEAIAVSLQPAP